MELADNALAAKEYVGSGSITTMDPEKAGSLTRKCAMAEPTAPPPAMTTSTFCMPKCTVRCILAQPEAMICRTPRPSRARKHDFNAKRDSREVHCSNLRMDRCGDDCRRPLACRTCRSGGRRPGRSSDGLD